MPANTRVAAWHEQDEYWEAVAQTIFSPARKGQARDDVTSVVSLLGLRAGASILDLGCGIGIHALELARRGYHATGVDRTRSFVADATREAQSSGLPAEFVCADMRELRRLNCFDAAISLFTSFGYFEDPDDERVVAANLHRSLRCGGSVLIDTDGREVFERGFSPCVRHQVEGTLALEERRMSPDHCWVSGRMRFIEGPRGHAELRFRYRLYSADELAGLLSECGFVSVEVFGGLDGRPYDSEARRLVVVAQRPPREQGQRVEQASESVPAIRRGIEKTQEGTPALLKFITQKSYTYSRV